MKLQILPWAMCVLFGALAVFFIARFIISNNRNKTAKIIFDAIGEDSELAYIVIEKKSHEPIYVSDTLCTLFGLSKKMIKNDIKSLSWCMDKDEEDTLRFVIENWDRESGFEKEFEFFNIDTTERHFARARIAVFFGKYIIVKIEEISKHALQKEELMTEMDKLRYTDKQKANFMSAISHELRTPMNGILGMIELAKKNANNPSDMISYLDKADKLSQYLLSIINDLLDLTKMERDKVLLEHEKFDLLACFKQLSDMFATDTEEKNIEFVIRRENMDIRYVMGDSLRLMQVLTNFLSNAVKYTNPGGKIELAIKQLNKSDERVHMQFKVTDTGKGMEKEFLEHIFKPFAQESASTTREYGGTGLGMTIADNIVKLMGGYIVVDSEVGKGSEFSAYIPLEIAEGEQSFEDKIEDENDGKDTAEISLDGVRILMAEDNEINAEIATELFKTEGVEIEIAENGRIAVEKFRNCPDGYYDVIFMDIQMPEMDGWTAAQTIRNMEREYASSVPIFALSANAFAEDRRRSAQMGMNGHLSKPIHFEELKSILASELGR